MTVFWLHLWYITHDLFFISGSSDRRCPVPVSYMGLALLITLVGVAVCLLPLPFANDWQHQMSWKGIPWPWVSEHKGMCAPQVSACIDEYCTLFPSVCIVRPYVCIVTLMDMRHQPDQINTSECKALWGEPEKTTSFSIPHTRRRRSSLSVIKSECEVLVFSEVGSIAARELVTRI